MTSLSVVVVFSCFLAYSLVFVYGAGSGTDIEAVGKNRIVILRNHGLSTMEKRNPGMRTVGARSHFKENAKQHHDRLLFKVKGKKGVPKKLHDYTQLMSGFSAVLTNQQVQVLQDDPDVLFVSDDKIRMRYTTRSYAFLGLDNRKTGAWLKTKGSDAIVGIIDSGIWPEDVSFSDSGYGPVPSRWKGTCNTGDGFDNFKCNRKLIGARSFGAGYAAESNNYLSNLVEMCSDYLSPRDIEGHGSHCAGIAAGSGAKASVDGRAYGTARGMAYSARIAVYKVFWCNDGGSTSDVIAAMDAAVQDGVDVISLSLGAGPSFPYAITTDPDPYAAYMANLAGVAVVYAAGNDGPAAFTVDNTSPWVMTVGAGTIDRTLVGAAVLGNKKVYRGPVQGSLGTPSASSKKLFPLISADSAARSGYAASTAEVCNQGSLDEDKVRGKIVFCLLGGSNYFDDQSDTVLAAGGVGMILRGEQSTGVVLGDTEYSVPTVLVSYSDGVAIKSYITTEKSPVGYLLPSTIAIGASAVEAPRLSDFSSVGPNAASFNILKPDITAPGQDIISSWTRANGQPAWSVLSGTSMATPHVAGAIALLAALHPTWTPSMYFSALATTARTRTNHNNMIMTSQDTVGTPFQIGAGYLNPNAATDPGLVYVITDYKAFLCSPDAGLNRNDSAFNPKTYCPKYPSTRAIDLNLPSVTFYNVFSKQRTTRTLTNVGAGGTYIASVIQPPGAKIAISPSKITFKEGQLKPYTVTITPLKRAGTVWGSYATRSTSSLTIKASLEWTFGSITWYDNKGHSVRSPISANVV